MDAPQASTAAPTLALRLFQAGVLLVALFALGHLGGFLQARHAARTDPKMAELTRAMREHRTSLMGFHPSILDFREYFSVNFSVLLIVAAALNLVALHLAHDKAAAIRAISLIDVGGMALLLVTSILFSVPQGIISCSTIAIVFIASWWRA